MSLSRTAPDGEQARQRLRDAVGQLLDARTRVEPAGVGVAASALDDGRGSIGLVAQSLYVAERDEAAGRPRWPSGGARGRVATREMFLRLLLAYLFRRMVGGGGRRRRWRVRHPVTATAGAVRAASGSSGRFRPTRRSRGAARA
jgi:hypothetical protein